MDNTKWEEIAELLDFLKNIHWLKDKVNNDGDFVEYVEYDIKEEASYNVGREPRSGEPIYKKEEVVKKATRQDMTKNNQLLELSIKVREEIFEKIKDL